MGWVRWQYFEKSEIPEYNLVVVVIPRDHPPKKKEEGHMSTPQRQIAGPGPLLSPDGNLHDQGWARLPLLDCNLENVRISPLRFLQSLRVKRWDYYGITTSSYYYSFTIGDIGYLGSIFAYAVNLYTGEYHEQTLTIPFGRGIQLPRNSTDGESFFTDGKVSLRFSARPGQRRLEVTWPNFWNNEPFAADVTFQTPDEHESLVLATSYGKRRFYYNRKMNCLPATGWVDYNGRHEELEPNQSLGNMDWGRGVWHYNSAWVWASASGFYMDGRTIGLNLGYGSRDIPAASEHCLILDGRVHKFEQVNIDFDPNDYMRAWKMNSPDGRLSLEFRPMKDRLAKTNLIVLFSEVHQMFGRYFGKLVTDDGETLLIAGLPGFAEHHRAHW